MHTLATVSRLDRAGFARVLNGVFEHTPWVVEALWDKRPFTCFDELSAAAAAVVQGASLEDQLALVRAHPPLAGRELAEGALTDASHAEQTGLALHELHPADRESLRQAAGRFEQKFGFPCIICVRNHQAIDSVIAEIEYRTSSTAGAALDESVRQVLAIADWRMRDRIDGAASLDGPAGWLTTHVLDTVRGRGAAGVAVSLWRWHAGDWRPLGATHTNDEGRTDTSLLAAPSFAAGRYQLRFDVGRYLATDGPGYLDIVPIQFTIAAEDEHYHVPLVLAPWGYSTYRGT